MIGDYNNTNNSNFQNNENHKSLWKVGKEQYKKFMEIKFKRRTNTVSLLVGILFTAIIILPLACLAFEIVELYWYSRATSVIFLSIAWGMLLLCNGLSTYISVRMIQVYEKDMADVQAIDAKAIFFYQTFNIGFALFTLAIMIFIWVNSI